MTRWRSLSKLRCNLTAPVVTPNWQSQTDQDRPSKTAIQFDDRSPPAVLGVSEHTWRADPKGSYEQSTQTRYGARRGCARSAIGFSRATGATERPPDRVPGS